MMSGLKGKDLSNRLHNYRQNLIQNGTISTPAGSMSNCESYWAYKERIQQYQKEKNISGIEFQTFEFNNHCIRIPYHFCQLLLMPQDEKAFKRYKAKIVGWFIEMAEINQKQGYSVIQEIDGENDWFYRQPTSIAQVIEVAAKFTFAKLFEDKLTPVFRERSREIYYWTRSLKLYLFNDLAPDSDEDMVVFALILRKVMIPCNYALNLI